MLSTITCSCIFDANAAECDWIRWYLLALVALTRKAWAFLVLGLLLRRQPTGFLHCVDSMLPFWEKLQTMQYRLQNLDAVLQMPHISAKFRFLSSCYFFILVSPCRLFLQFVSPIGNDGVSIVHVKTMTDFTLIFLGLLLSPALDTVFSHQQYQHLCAPANDLKPLDLDYVKLKAGYATFFFAEPRMGRVCL